MCLLYGYTLSYCMEELTLMEVFNLYEEGLRWNGVDVDKYQDEPDREQLYKTYGNQIKRPEGVSE